MTDQQQETNLDFNRTEKAILDGLDFGDVDNDPTKVKEPEQGNDNAEQDAKEQKQEVGKENADAGQGEQEPSGSSKENSEGEPKEAKPEATAKPEGDDTSSKESSEAKPQQGKDNGRDLIDFETGAILAKAGPERRAYENKAINNFHKAVALTQELNEENKRLKEVPYLGQEFGINQEELKAGALMMQAFKKDPETTIKNLVAEAAKRGIKLDDLGVSSSVTAIERVIDEKLKPFTDKQAAEEEANKQKGETEKVLNTFISNNPDAEQHLSTLAGMINKATEQGISLSLDKAWIELLQWANNQGVNLSKPDPEKLRALQNKPSESVNGTGGDKQKRNLPPTNGGGGASPDTVEQNENAFDENSDIDDIIKNAMGKAGFDTSNL